MVYSLSHEMYWKIEINQIQKESVNKKNSLHTLSNSNDVNPCYLIIQNFSLISPIFARKGHFILK